MNMCRKCHSIKHAPGRTNLQGGTALTDQITPEQARQALEDEQRKRLEVCQKELDELLQKYGCALNVQLGISQDGRIVANVVLVNAN